MSTKPEKVHASDCQCCKCGDQAVAFWPCVDPDIPSRPYCRPCLDDAKNKLTAKLYKEGFFGA